MGKVACTCQQCGKVFTTKLSYIKNGRGKYCSRKCYLVANYVSIEKVCMCCGKNFIVPPSRIKRGEGKYCSIKCSNIGQTKHVKRKKHTRTAPSTTICNQCGKGFKSPPSKQSKFCSIECLRLSSKSYHRCIQCGKEFSINKGSNKNGKFCSKNCFHIHNRGSNQSQYAGGKYYYGEYWLQQRKLAYERDGGICQYCQRKPRKGERQFAVHHIIKRRNFAKDDPRANELSNLITLCPQCHPKAERGLIAVPARLL